MIINEKEWLECVKKNDESYGKACVDTARECMKILDEKPGDFDTHELICQGSDNAKTGGITGFMAGCVASMISDFHSRGEEFRLKWNTDNQINDEGDKANESGGILNPALMTIDI